MDHKINFFPPKDNIKNIKNALKKVGLENSYVLTGDKKNSLFIINGVNSQESFKLDIDGDITEITTNSFFIFNGKVFQGNRFELTNDGIIGDDGHFYGIATITETHQDVRPKNTKSILIKDGQPIDWFEFDYIKLHPLVNNEVYYSGISKKAADKNGTFTMLGVSVGVDKKLLDLEQRVFVYKGIKILNDERVSEGSSGLNITKIEKNHIYMEERLPTGKKKYLVSPGTKGSLRYEKSFSNDTAMPFGGRIDAEINMKNSGIWKKCQYCRTDGIVDIDGTKFNSKTALGLI